LFYNNIKKGESMHLGHGMYWGIGVVVFVIFIVMMYNSLIAR